MSLQLLPACSTIISPSTGIAHNADASNGRGLPPPAPPSPPPPAPPPPPPPPLEVSKSSPLSQAASDSAPAIRMHFARDLNCMGASVFIVYLFCFNFVKNISIEKPLSHSVSATFVQFFRCIDAFILRLRSENANINDVLRWKMPALLG
ncbi:MAG: hypothetical protein C0509_05475 [Acinetobacter sp.]|nr:hypothetical protein [Acinetobacter sp.]